MSDSVALTDEELAHLEKTALSYGHLVNSDALRLIADLRAARTEVARLRGEVDEFRKAYADRGLSGW